MKYTDYLSTFSKILNDVSVTDHAGISYASDQALKIFLNIARSTKKNKGTLYFIGNGGSAGICSHMAIDYTKNGKLPSKALLDGATLTCIGNDISFDSIFSEQIKFYCQNNDLLIAISSSGNSDDIINAALEAKKIGMKIITLSGFSENNKLRKLGDLNFYLNSNQYGYVEIGHALLLHCALDFHTCK